MTKFNFAEKYHGGFSNRDDVARAFEAGTGSRWSEGFVPAVDFPTDDEILLASYGTPPYEGYDFVLFERDGTLFEVHGSHCSCYGLEGQWSPEETTWLFLFNRKDNLLSDYKEHSPGAHQRLKELLRERVGAAVDA